MKHNKGYRRIAAVLTAAAVMMMAALPAFAAETGKADVLDEVMENGTDRITYKVDPDRKGANAETVTERSTDTNGKSEISTTETAAGEEGNTEDQAAEETDQGMTMTVTVAVEDILNYMLPEETEVSQVGTVVTKKALLNVRAGAGKENEVIGQLKPGDTVQVTGNDGTWYQVTLPGKEGYVYGEYLDVATDNTEPAVSREDLMQILTFILENADREPEAEGLTPEGNMQLVDDKGPSTGEGQQFITMTSKNGNYFYLIIDRDDKGNENVHLLNMVDERDLLDLMEDEEAEYYEELLEDQKQKTEDTKAEIEKLKDEQQKTEKTMETMVASEVQEDPASEEPVPEKESGKGKIILILILLGALGGCGIWLAKKLKKSSRAKKKANEADIDDMNGEEIDLPMETEGDE